MFGNCVVQSRFEDAKRPRHGIRSELGSEDVSKVIGILSGDLTDGYDIELCLTVYLLHLSTQSHHPHLESMVDFTINRPEGEILLQHPCERHRVFFESSLIDLFHYVVGK